MTMATDESCKSYDYAAVFNVQKIIQQAYLQEQKLLTTVTTSL
jgi:hypothetical protein